MFIPNPLIKGCFGDNGLGKNISLFSLLPNPKDTWQTLADFTFYDVEKT